MAKFYLDDSVVKAQPALSSLGVGDRFLFESKRYQVTDSGGEEVEVLLLKEITYKVSAKKEASSWVGARHLSLPGKTLVKILK